MAFQTWRSASVREPNESVWMNARAQSASIGRRIDTPAIRSLRLSKASTMARMQIAKTAQTKAAFHHGSTVPYGMGVRTIRVRSAPNTSLFNKAERSFTQRRKGAKKDA